MRGLLSPLFMVEKRRRRDEPFNPFAPNAGQKARDRKDSGPKPRPNQRQSTQNKPSQQDLINRQKAAMQALREKQSESKPEHKPPPRVAPKIKSPPPKKKVENKQKDGREERLASLRAKSDATKQFAKDAIAPKKSEIDDKVSKEENIVESVSELIPEEPVVEISTSDSISKKAAANVFKTIKTEVTKRDKRPKKRGHDKRGGGRQPQTRKLDRRKYLEYKYVARDLLDNESISEEHRSNVLGQIWAKGERIGVESALEFIGQKEEELIIPNEIAEEFRKLVKKYTTKR